MNLKTSAAKASCRVPLLLLTEDVSGDDQGGDGESDQTAWSCCTYSGYGERSTDLDPIWRQPVICAGSAISLATRNNHFVWKRGMLSRPAVIDVDERDIYTVHIPYLMSPQAPL